MVFSANSITVTGSFGLTTATAGACRSEEMIHAADEALYAAKAAGRDRIEFRPLELTCPA
jgi:GGDEF domain-containing protein